MNPVTIAKNLLTDQCLGKLQEEGVNISFLKDVAGLTEDAVKAFEKRFGETPNVASKAPGRVNLIGEHTDYNDGFVLPMALPMVTVVVGRQTSTGTCRVETLSEDVTEERYCEFPVKGVQPGAPKWANYVKGVIAQFTETVPSFDAVIISSVPLGGGVSSSASLEVATYMFAEQLAGIQQGDTPDITKILRCQKAEHDYAGMPCGIMDQFISVKGKPNQALFIDCRSQEGKLLNLFERNIVFLVSNTNVKHELTGSEYPRRRQQCEDAAKALGKASLREASMEDLEANKSSLDEETYRRARHVITEIKRTDDAAVALEQGDHKGFGRLMVESHNSLRDDYEVSCKELDILVESAMEMKDEGGVFGSRMTGGGFGGCTVSIMLESSVPKVIPHMASKYKSVTGKEASFFLCSGSDGASPVKL